MPASPPTAALTATGALLAFTTILGRVSRVTAAATQTPGAQPRSATPRPVAVYAAPTTPPGPTANSVPPDGRGTPAHTAAPVQVKHKLVCFMCTSVSCYLQLFFLPAEFIILFANFFFFFFREWQVSVTCSV